MVKFVSSKEYSPEALNRVLTVPNVISFLRICSIPYLAILIAQNKMWLALIVLAISAFSDCADGYIARTFNQAVSYTHLTLPTTERV